MVCLAEDAAVPAVRPDGRGDRGPGFRPPVPAGPRPQRDHGLALGSGPGPSCSLRRRSPPGCGHCRTTTPKRIAPRLIPGLGSLPRRFSRSCRLAWMGGGLPSPGTITLVPQPTAQASKTAVASPRAREPAGWRPPGDGRVLPRPGLACVRDRPSGLGTRLRPASGRGEPRSPAFTPPLLPRPHGVASSGHVDAFRPAQPPHGLRRGQARPAASWRRLDQPRPPLQARRAYGAMAPVWTSAPTPWGSGPPAPSTLSRCTRGPGGTAGRSCAIVCTAAVGTAS